jgi:hypothetical protein
MISNKSVSESTATLFKDTFVFRFLEGVLYFIVRVFGFPVTVKGQSRRTCFPVPFLLHFARPGLYVVSTCLVFRLFAFVSLCAYGSKVVARRRYKKHLHNHPADDVLLSHRQRDNSKSQTCLRIP